MSEGAQYAATAFWVADAKQLNQLSSDVQRLSSSITRFPVRRLHYEPDPAQINGETQGSARGVQMHLRFWIEELCGDVRLHTHREPLLAAKALSEGQIMTLDRTLKDSAWCHVLVASAILLLIVSRLFKFS